MRQGISAGLRTLLISTHDESPSCAAISSATIPPNDTPPDHAGYRCVEHPHHALGVTLNQLARLGHELARNEQVRKCLPLLRKPPLVARHPR
jgi:hypothetical protein